MTHDVAMEAESQFLLLGNVFLCTSPGLEHFSSLTCFLTAVSPWSSIVFLLEDFSVFNCKQPMKKNSVCCLKQSKMKSSKAEGS